MGEEPSMDIRIRFDPTLGEFEHFHRLMAGRTGVFGCLSLATNLVFILLLGAVTVLELAAGASIYAMLLSSFCILLLLVFFVVQYAVLPATIRKQYRQWIAISGTHEIAFSDSEVAGKDERGESHIPWNKYVKWVEDDVVLALFQTDLMVNLVPKRCLSAGGMEEIRRTLAGAAVPRQTIRPIGTVVMTVFVFLILMPAVCLVGLLMAYTRLIAAGG
jgi:hypothetical protein